MRELFVVGARLKAGSGLYPVDLALLVPRLLFALKELKKKIIINYENNQIYYIHNSLGSKLYC